MKRFLAILVLISVILANPAIAEAMQIKYGPISKYETLILYLENGDRLEAYGNYSTQLTLYRPGDTTSRYFKDRPVYALGELPNGNIYMATQIQNEDSSGRYYYTSYELILDRSTLNTISTNKSDHTAFHDQLLINIDSTISTINSSAQGAQAAANNAYNTALTANANITNAKTEIQNNINSIKTDIQNSVQPHIEKVVGLSGATCTKGTTFTVVISASGANQYCARVSGDSWSPWAAENNISVPVGSTPGAKTIEVKARNSLKPASETSSSIIVFKI